MEIIKVNEDNHSERIPNTTFEIRKVDDALVDTVTTDKNGRVFVALEDGSYYAKEVTSNKSFRLDDTPHYFEIKDGKHVTLQVTNKKLSGIVIHKIDSVTGEGIYGVKFVLYDANKKPIGEYTSDDEGYIYIDEIPGGLSGRFYLRELEAAPGYTLDKQYKTVYVSPGKTVEIEWENTAVTGQIQIYKYAAEYNEVTGTAAGTPLKGAVYEIVNARSGKVVDYITTDARGVAASKPLPLTRYQIREVTAPSFWQIDPTVHDVTLEYPGQIIKLSAYDKPASLGVTITKRGNAQVMAGQSMRYDLTVANTSNVPLESFFWHDKIPYDVARPTTLTTGTYSARLNYRILYKTNYNASYEGNLISNANLFISQYCAAKELDFVSISLTDMEQILRAGLTHLYSFSRTMELRTVPAEEDGEEDTAETWYIYTIRYNGEAYFADTIFALTDEQKRLAENYAENLSLFLGDGLFQYAPSTNTITTLGDVRFTDGETEVIYFNQLDERYANQPYGTDHIGGYGCGPTSMAIVVSSLTSETVDPVQMARWAYEHGYWCSKSGSYHTLIPGAAQAWGLSVEGCTASEPQRILDALADGKLVVALMTKGHFTKSGHFIVLRGVQDEKILVADPASYRRSQKVWDLSIILNEASRRAGAGGPFWIIGL